jgi:hypothetical protein
VQVRWALVHPSEPCGGGMYVGQSGVCCRGVIATTRRVPTPSRKRYQDGYARAGRTGDRMVQPPGPEAAPPG